eukprot:TRINITY_DN65110_c0_g1_i1.p1 TRINITY_DN65110_c0_g1~~TRINITY_DN65110_c0_g1_i1.p1  ORF type:complete len:358 (+),score=53.19 TRINITY_DN65110_c0_g1_i1:95-1168(+)
MATSQGQAYNSAQHGLCRNGILADDFLEMLRHLSDAALRDASQGRRGKGGRIAIERSLLQRNGRYILAVFALFERAAKAVQDLMTTIAVLTCIFLLKVGLRVVEVQRACCCCCRSTHGGFVDRFTSLQWSLMNMIMQLKGVKQEKIESHAVVAECLGKHRISMALTTRVRKYLDRSQPQMIREYNVETLRQLSTELIVDLHEEMRVPALSAHPFFVSLRVKHPHLVWELYHDALEPMLCFPDAFVFSAGEACSYMYFIISGHVLYNGQVKALTPIRRTLHGGQWLSEAALWTGWVHRGDLRIVTDCLLFALGAAGFARVISSHKSAHVFAAGYARKFVESLNRGPQTDLTEAAPVDS